MVKKIIAAIVVIALVAGVLWLGNENKRRESEEIYTVSVEPVSLTSTVSTATNVNGKVKIKDNKIENVVLDYNGVIKELAINDRQTVEKGDVLFTVQKCSSADYKLKKESLEETLAQYESKLEINNIVSSSDYDAQESLIQEQVKSVKAKQNSLNSELEELKEQREKKQITYKEYKKQKDSLEDAILETKVKIQEIEYSLKDIYKSKKEQSINAEQINAEIQETKKQIKELNAGQNVKIVSPKSGTVSFSRELYAGLSVQQNQSLVKIMSADEASSYYVQVELADSEYANVNEDSEVSLVCGSGINSKEYKGHISSEKPTIYYSDEIAYYVVKIEFEEECDELIVDMPVQVKIDSKVNISVSGENASSYYIVPIYAVVSRNDRNVVFLYQKDESKNTYIAKLVYVDIITSSSNTVIVSSAELNQESIVITEGNYDLYGGETVIMDQGENSGYVDLNLFG